MSKPKDTVLEAIHIRLLRSSKEDVRAHEIIQSQHQGKKKFIIEAILAYHDTTVGRASEQPSFAEADGSGGNAAGGADAIIARIAEMETRIIEAVEENANRDPFQTSGEDARLPPPTRSSSETGFDEEDIVNFQLAAEAFGSLAEDED